MVDEQRNSAFVQEGSGDIETQKRNEQINREVGELVTRKSLSDQLRENSKKKRQQFQKQTREKNSFTRVSNEDLDHINKIKSDEIEKLREFSQWAESEERKRLKKQRLLQLSTESDGLSSGTSTNSDLIPTEIRIPKEVKSSKMKNTLGVIRKKRTKGVSKPTERGR